MKNYRKQQLKRLRVYFIIDGVKRSNYIKRKNIFKNVGDNFFFQPRILPSEPKLIKFGDNVSVASGVLFITHDIIHNVLNNIENSYKYKTGCIEVGSNVFIGANSIILPNVKIGSNVIIAAGSVICKDVLDNTVVGGNPIKKIMTFDEFMEKRKNDNSISYNYLNDEDLWRYFYEIK